jgi:hypothetical protein
MSNRSTARMAAICVCGRPDFAEVHRVPPRPAWWKRLLSLAWPRWTWGHTKDVHAFVDRDALGLARNQLRRVRRELERKRRRAAGG